MEPSETVIVHVPGVVIPDPDGADSGEAQAEIPPAVGDAAVFGAVQFDGDSVDGIEEVGDSRDQEGHMHRLLRQEAAGEAAGQLAPEAAFGGGLVAAEVGGAGGQPGVAAGLSFRPQAASPAATASSSGWSSSSRSARAAEMRR